ncbi:unnamed protein product, partial [marine sediment metagenome]
MAAFFYGDAGQVHLTLPNGWTASATEKRLMLEGDMSFDYDEVDQDIKHHEFGNSLVNRICTEGAARFNFNLRTIIDVASGIDMTMPGLAAMFGDATQVDTVDKPFFMVEDPSGANRRTDAMEWQLAPYEDGAVVTDVTKHIIFPLGSPLVTGRVPFGTSGQRAWAMVVEAMVTTETIDTIE